MLTVRDNKFLICLGAALTAHIALLSLPITTVELNKSRTIKRLPIKLQLIPPALPSRAIDSKLSTITKSVHATTVEVAALKSSTKLEANADAVVNTGKQETSEAPETIQTIKDNSGSLSSRTVIEQLKAQLHRDRENTANTSTPKTFSKADFINPTPTTDEVTTLILPKLFTRAFAASSRSASGQSTDVIRNAKGDAMCWQQRGIPGETQQWYRVPLALCGHLSDP